MHGRQVLIIIIDGKKGLSNGQVQPQKEYIG